MKWLHGWHMSDDADSAAGDAEGEETEPRDGGAAEQAPTERVPANGDDDTGRASDEERETTERAGGEPEPNQAGDEQSTAGAEERTSAGATDGQSSAGADDEPIPSRGAGVGEVESAQEPAVEDSDLVEQVAAFDAGLADDVEALVREATALRGDLEERGVGLEERANRIRELESDLKERADRVRALERTLDERTGRLDELEERLKARDQEVAEQAVRIEDLEGQLDAKDEQVQELTSKLKQTQADFQNYKKRRDRQEEEIRERATEDLVERLLDVRDNLRRAIDADAQDLEGLTEGVKMTLKEFDRVLDAEGVEKVDPEPGSTVDPTEHEVMIRTESEQPEGTIAEVYQPGYRMGEKLIRSARVTVSEGPPADADEPEADASEDAPGTDEPPESEPEAVEPTDEEAAIGDDSAGESGDATDAAETGSADPGPEADRNGGVTEAADPESETDPDASQDGAARGGEEPETGDEVDTVDGE